MCSTLFDLSDDDLRSLMGRAADTAVRGETGAQTGQESRSTVAEPQLA
jgi:hypothetical protein